jgi:peptide-methionine (S)-S-oxide reductase
VRRSSILLAAGAVLGAACLAAGARNAAEPASAGPPPAGLSRAIFAGGCFWCMEPPFEKLTGVHSVTSGYIGGKEKNPTYEQVSNHQTGHAEAVEILFDPKKVTYERLLEVFWHNVDPTTNAGQFCDRGHQYRTGIFVVDAEQRRLAEASKQQIERTKRFGPPVLTAIEDAATFYRAEEYHQDFYKKSPVRYYSYRTGCGRDARLKELWGDAAGH